MHWQYTPYIIPLFIGAIVSGALVLWGWRRRPSPGASWFTAMMFSAGLWASFYILEMGSTTLPATVLWSKMQYLGAVTLPVTWLSLVLIYTGQRQWLTRRNVALLFIIPLITLVLVWTNEHHELLWIDVGMRTGAPFNALSFTRGAWYWVNIAYAYLNFALSTIFLVVALAHSTPLYRRQIITLLIFSLITWLGNLAYIAGLTPWGMDMTPINFSASGLLIAWGLFRYRILDIMPVARDVLIENMRDGVIMLDPLNRVVDLNPAAQVLIGDELPEIIGQPIISLFTACAASVKLCQEVGDKDLQTEVALDNGAGGERIFDLRVSPLHDWRGQLTGRLMLWHDVTERRKIETEIRLLLTLTQNTGSAPDFAGALHTALHLIVVHTGWIFGEAWLPSADGAVLENSQTSYYQGDDSATLGRFDQNSRKFTFAPGKGLPGRVWLSGQPEWQRDISSLTRQVYHRVQYAIEAGLKAALGVPVLIEEELLAVLVFYMTEPRTEDQRLVELVTAVAAQLGATLRYKQSEETGRLQAAALNAAANGIVITDSNGTINWVNPAFTKLTGYAFEEAVGQNPRLLQSGEHDQAFFKELWEKVVAGQPWHGEIVNRRQDGSLYTEEQTITPMRNKRGEISHFIAIKQDITARKKAEEELRKLSRAVEQSGSTIVITDLEGNIEFVNPAFTRITGYSAEEALGQNPRVLKSGKHPPELYRELWDTITRGEVWQGEMINRKKNGDLYWETATISPVKDEKGQTTHYLAVKDDITSRKEFEAALAQEQQKSAALLHNVLPAGIIAEIKERGQVAPVSFECVSIMFTDFANFTSTAEQLSPQELVDDLHYYFSFFDTVIEKYGLEKIKTIGDSYMCAGGVPFPNETHAVDIVRAALEIAAFTQRDKETRQQHGRHDWKIRIGISSGPVVAGIVGQKKYAYDLWGDTVVIAARMESSGEIGRVNISAGTYALVKEQFDCEYRGKVFAKHKGQVEMYFVNGNSTTATKSSLSKPVAVL
ncbi:MAG TPA: PAS domain S-box protein [Thermoflexia bacterium]|nr:PAS domain S-box protein [Thermoflexia bacterium]